MTLEVVLASLANGVMLGGLYALIALGLTLIFGVMKTSTSPTARS